TLLQDGLLHEHGCLHPERESYRIGGTAVDREALAVQAEVDLRVERVFLKVVDDDADDAALDLADQVLQEIVRHRTRCRDAFHRESDRIRPEHTDTEGKDFLLARATEDPPRLVRDRVDDQRFHIHSYPKSGCPRGKI